MLNELTSKQLKIAQQYRDKYFSLATSTRLADRTRAENAAKRIAEIGRVKDDVIHWVNSPMEGETLKESIDDLFWKTVKKAFGELLGEHLSASFRNSFSGSIKDSVRSLLVKSFKDSLGSSFAKFFTRSFVESFYVLFDVSICESLGDCDCVYLWDSLWDSINDSGWLCKYTCCAEMFGVEYEQEAKELLHLYNEISASCFAFWLTPGSIILCERPEDVSVVDGKLITAGWRE